MSQERFDAVIVGHRFPAEEKYVLAVEAKAKSNTPVLLVCGAARDSEIPATNRVYALEGSAGLLAALSALFPAETETRSLSGRLRPPAREGGAVLFREEDENLEVLPFEDRAEAGRVLASKLSAYGGRDDVIVLGLPRGGVPVAFAVAGVLHVPLDVFVVSKLGTPWNKEPAMGAVAEGGVQVLDLSIVRALCVSEEDIQAAATAARKELECRQGLYRGDRRLLELAGETVILVDDGIATGCSILAAIAAIRRRNAGRIVVAVPVAPASGCNAIRMEADEVISVANPEQFLAVSQWYQDFSQISDKDVQRLLESAIDPILRAA